MRSEPGPFAEIARNPKGGNATAIFQRSEISYRSAVLFSNTKYERKRVCFLLNYLLSPRTKNIAGISHGRDLAIDCVTINRVAFRGIIFYRVTAHFCIRRLAVLFDKCDSSFAS